MATVSDSRRKGILSECEKKGKPWVRERLTPTPHITRDCEFDAVAGEWLRQLDEEHALAASDKRDVREKRTLAIAEETNDLARETNKHAARASLWAMIAAIIAAAAMIYTAKDSIKPIFGL
jgi:hypothetical protein